ncbi:MAG: hypothetical protein MH132_08775 [Hydrotalea sp.]|nr:hypothetical protein [Hydrotalea sp.]
MIKETEAVFLNFGVVAQTIVVITDWNGIASNSLFCDVKHPQFKGSCYFTSLLFS